MPSLHFEQLIAAPLEQVFDFHKDPYNLLKITPPEMNMIVKNEDPVIMACGTKIIYQIKILGMPLRWHSMITEYDPPHRFVDVQMSGPYKKWHHTHTFKAEGDATLVIDDVDYKLPLGYLGAAVAGHLVIQQLAKIFSHREQKLASFFSGTANEFHHTS